jgi:hypothetical protein
MPNWVVAKLLAGGGKPKTWKEKHKPKYEPGPKRVDFLIV